jgi:hypothetical protein
MNYIELTQIQWTPLKSLETLKLWIMLFCEFTNLFQMDFNIIVFQIVDLGKKPNNALKS